MLKTIAGITALGCMLIACRTSSPSHQAQALTEPLDVPLDGVGVPFEFCPEKRSLNLINALWLSFFAANQSARSKDLGPLLEELGFGDRGEGEAFRRSWYELRIKKIQENIQGEASEDVWDSNEERLLRLEEVKLAYAKRYEAPYVEDRLSAKEYEARRRGAVNPRMRLQFILAKDGSLAAGAAKREERAVYAEHRSKDFSIILFRSPAASDRLEAFIDGESSQEPLEGLGMVHSGLQKALAEVLDQLIGILEARSSLRPIKLWLGGHGAAGGLATLMAARILQMQEHGLLANVQLRGSYTFGAPRVGDRVFAAAVDRWAVQRSLNFVRFQNFRDPISDRPDAPSIKDSYSHAGALASFDAKGSLHTGESRDIERPSDDGGGGLALDGAAMRFHENRAYLELIKKALGKARGDASVRCEPHPSDQPLKPSQENMPEKTNA